MSKKMICLLLALAMMLSVLAGCGSSASSSSASEAAESSAEASEVSAEEEAAEPAESAADEAQEDTAITDLTTESVEEGAITFPLEEPVTLTYWFAPETDGLEIISDFNENLMVATAEELTNVHIDFKTVSFTAQDEQFSLMVASNDYPDIIQGFGGNYTSGIDNAIDEEIIIDLTDMLADYAPNYSYLRDNNSEIAKSTTTDTGRVGSFYFLIGDAELGPRSGLWIRQDWLEELGLDVPTTYDELHDVLLAFKDAYNTSNTFRLASAGYFSNNVLLGGYNVSAGFYDEDGTIKYGFIEDGFYEYLVMLNQWYSEGLISSDFVSASESSMMFDSSDIINSSCGVWSANYRGDDSWKDSAVDEGFTPLAIADMTPTGTEQIHVGGQGSNVNSAGCVVSVDCENPEIAVAWIDWWYSDEATLLNTYGIEGVTFNYNEDGQPLYTDLILNNDQGNARAMRNIYTGMSFAFRVYRVVTSSYDNGYDVTDRGTWDSNRDNEWDISSYIARTTEEGETYSSIMSTIETYVEENIPKFIIGARDLSEWDQYVQDIINMGIEEVIEIEAAAVERYNER